MVSTVKVLLSCFKLRGHRLPNFYFIGELIFQNFELVFSEFLRVYKFGVIFFIFYEFTFQFGRRIRLHCLTTRVPRVN